VGANPLELGESGDGYDRSTIVLMRSRVHRRLTGRSQLTNVLWMLVLYLALLYVALRLGAMGTGDLRITD
jgi:hypothetical protein